MMVKNLIRGITFIHIIELNLNISFIYVHQHIISNRNKFITSSVWGIGLGGVMEGGGG